MKKILYILLAHLLPMTAFADDTLGLSKAKVGLSTNSLESMIATIIKTGLTLVGAVALAMVVYGGFLYISAAGDESQIKKAKTVIIYAIIGIIVIGVAYALVAFVIGAFSGGSGGGAGGVGGEGNN